MYGFLLLLELSVPIDYTYGIGLDFFPDLAAYILFLTAAFRLSDYAPGFARLKKILVPLLVLSAVDYGLTLFCIGGRGLSVLSVILTVIDRACLVLQPAALIFLFTGIVVLAESVELPKIAKRARIALVLGMTDFVLRLFIILCADLSLPVPPSVMNPLQGVATLLWMVFIVFGEVVLFNCYMYICYEGEEQVDAGSFKNPIESLVERIKKRKDD